MEELKISTTFSIPLSMVEKITRIAKERGISKSEFFREILDFYFENNK